MRFVLIGVAVIMAILGIAWVAQGNDFFLYSYFAPRYEAVRRATFEQSRSFNEGMSQELEGMYRDYMHASDPNEKAAIRSLVQHRVAGYDISQIENPQLRSFVQQMMQGG